MGNKPLRDHPEGAKVRNASEMPDEQSWLTAAQVAALTGVSKKTIQNGCKAGLYPGARKARINGGEGWKIPLSGLTPLQQVAWHEGRIQGEASPPSVPTRDAASPVETGQLEATRQTRQADKLWLHFSKARENDKNEAIRRAGIVAKYFQLLDAGLPKSEIDATLKAEYDVSPATTWRYRKLIDGQPTSEWVPRLLPEWKGKTQHASFSEAAWDWIRDQYLIQSQPSLRAVLRRAQKLAAEHSWTIPSYDAVLDKIKTIPRQEVVFKREGRDALKRTVASLRHDYSLLELHEEWNSDGHKADLFVRDGRGKIFRPIIVAWQETRSRKILGYAVGESETADLVRRALHRSIVTCGNVLPHRARMDNGMAYASKQNTGGAPNRHRFKIKEDEIPGAMTLLGIEYHWVTPGHGQSKPIESFWRNLTEMARRKEFTQAYCGNKPEAKPKEFDKGKAVPLQVFTQVLGETISDYNACAHRGDSMYGKSPNQIYDELIISTKVRYATESQLRICLLDSKRVIPHRENGSLEVLKNVYWCPKCSDLENVPGYSVRYDGDHPESPVMLYLNDQYLFDVPLHKKTGFRDKDQAKEIARLRKEALKNQKEKDAIWQRMLEAENPDFLRGDDVSSPTGATPQKPKIIELTRIPLQVPKPANNTPEEIFEPLFSPADFAKLRADEIRSKSK